MGFGLKNIKSMVPGKGNWFRDVYDDYIGDPLFHKGSWTKPIMAAGRTAAHTMTGGIPAVGALVYPNLLNAMAGSNRDIKKKEEAEKAARASKNPSAYSALYRRLQEGDY